MLLVIALLAAAPTPAKSPTPPTATATKPATSPTPATAVPAPPTATAKEPAAPTAVSPAREADIRKLMDITGMAKLGPGVAEQVMASFREAYPKVPESLWTELQKQMDPASVVTLMVPVYDRHFTADEVKQLIAFYETPLGKKVLKELPGVTTESMQIAETWGYKTGERMAGQLEAKGYTLPQPTRSSAPQPNRAPATPAR